MWMKIAGALGVVLVGVVAVALARPQEARGATTKAPKFILSRQTYSDGWNEKVFMYDPADGRTWIYSRDTETWDPVLFNRSGTDDDRPR